MATPTWLHAYVLDPLERAGSTFVQQFVVALMVLGGGVSLLVTQNWLLALDTATFAGAVSVVTSIATFAIPELPPVWDWILRVVKTFAQSLSGTMLASTVAPSVIHAPWRGALATAFVVALAAAVKGLASFAAPWSNGASILPTHAALYDHDAAPIVDYDAVYGPGAEPDADTPTPPAAPRLGGSREQG